MKDEGKTREQLVDELIETRRRIAELEALETEWRETEKALRESERHYRLLAENASDIIWTADKNLQLTYISPSIERHSGYTPEEMMGMTLEQSYTPASVEAIMKAFEEEMSLEKTWVEGQPTSRVLEVEAYNKDGSTDWIETHVTVLRDQDGNMTGMVGVTRGITERKQAEEELKAAQEYARSLIDSSLDMIISADQNRRIVEFNVAAQNTFGYSKEEVLGKQVDIIYADPAQASNVREAVLKTGQFSGEIVNKRKNGETFPSYVAASAMEDKDGKFLGVMGISRDITERKQAEEALQESEERYRAIFEQAADSIVLVDADTGALVKFNDRAHEDLGYTREEFEKLKIGDFEVIESAEEVARHTEKIVRQGADTFETKHRTKGGEIRDVQVSCRAISIRGRDFVQSIWHDVTERKRVEELRESEGKYSALVEQAVDGIIIAQDGVLKFANRAHAEMTGYTVEEMEGMPFLDTVAPELRDVVAQRFGSRMAGEQLSPVYETKVRCKDGTVREVEARSRTIQYQGRPADLSTVRDVTERKRMEQQLKEYSENLERMVEDRTRELEDAQEKLIRAEKLAAIGELAGGLGHELRSPLGVIKFSADFLKTKLGDTADEKVRRHLNLLEKQVDACDKTVADVLDFSRPSKLNIEEVDMNQVVQEVVQASTLPRNVEVSTSLADNLSPVIADAGQMGRVLSNLVTNAVQAMPYGGRLTLSTVQRGGFVEVRVADTGVGIPEEKLDKIFEPLFTTKPKGIGLGLAIVKTLVDRQNGTVEVESQVGKDTTFTVKLPIAGGEVRSHE